MKQKNLILSFLILIVFFSTSCIFSGPSLKGNGNVAEETRKTSAFEKIKVSRGMNVYISQGDETSIVVEADQNLLDAIETKVEDNTLKITTNANIRKSKSKKVYITTPNISDIKSFAGSNVFSETVLESKNLELASSAGSNIKLTVKAGNLNVSASAGSNIKLDGTADSFTGKATAGSNIKAEELAAKNCEARSNSGSNIWITAKRDFEGHASSGGNVFYYGNPNSVDVHSSSGGNVIKK